jgi:hypothetical protein
VCTCGTRLLLLAGGGRGVGVSLLLLQRWTRPINRVLYAAPRGGFAGGAAHTIPIKLPVLCAAGPCALRMRPAHTHTAPVAAVVQRLGQLFAPGHLFATAPVSTVNERECGSRQIAWHASFVCLSAYGVLGGLGRWLFGHQGRSEFAEHTIASCM